MRCRNTTRFSRGRLPVSWTIRWRQLRSTLPRFPRATPTRRPSAVRSSTPGPDIPRSWHRQWRASGRTAGLAESVPSAGASCPAAATRVAKTGPMSIDQVLRDVKFLNGVGTLAGSLGVPAGAEASPGVVMTAGSGPSDRNNDTYFPPLRQHLLNAGFAVLSYDKRGVGESSGGWCEAARECARTHAATRGVTRGRRLTADRPRTGGPWNQAPLLTMP